MGPNFLDSTEVSWDNSCLEGLGWWSVESHLFGRSPSRIFTSRVRSVYRRFRYRLRTVFGQQPPLRIVVSPMLPIFDQSSGASGRPLCRSGVSPSASRLLRLPVCRHHHHYVISPQGGRNLIGDSQCSGSVNPAVVRSPSHSFGSSVLSRTSQCTLRLSVTVHKF